jgi:hypothetical protein
MLASLRRRLSYANAMATIAVFIALGGSSYAVATGSIASRELKDNTLRSADLKNNDIRAKDVRNGTLAGVDVKNDALTGADMRESTLQTVPSQRRPTGQTPPTRPTAPTRPLAPTAQRSRPTSPPPRASTRSARPASRRSGPAARTTPSSRSCNRSASTRTAKGSSTSRAATPVPAARRPRSTSRPATDTPRRSDASRTFRTMPMVALTPSRPRSTSSAGVCAGKQRRGKRGCEHRDPQRGRLPGGRMRTVSTPAPKAPRRRAPPRAPSR